MDTTLAPSTPPAAPGDLPRGAPAALPQEDGRSPRPRLLLDGGSLTPGQLACLARREAVAAVDPAARARVAAARAAAERVTARRPVYGHSTGVGANRTTVVPEGAADSHGLRLLRSHGGGIGPLVPEIQARAMLAVRLNQILGAGSALGDAVVDALTQALTHGHVPAVHGLGAIGTADLTALAELGLTLAGELPWQGGDPGLPAPAPVAITRWDALPLMSSSALTIGQSALAATDLRRLLDRLPQVAALTLTAIRGGREAFAAPVHARRPHPGSVRTAARMRQLLDGADWQPPLVQDPFGFRCLPQVHGAALDSWAALDSVLAVELNSSVENPLLALEPEGGEDYHHHGGFHMASLALALDQFRLALLGTVSLSTARLGVLLEPSFSGLPPFLAAVPDDASSGIMIVEYAAQSALAELRGGAQPVTLGHAVISRGVEEHASFASAGARRLLEAVRPAALVLGCELLAAVRALRMRGIRPPSGELRDFLADASAVLPDRLEDRRLTDDIHAAADLLLGR